MSDFIGRLFWMFILLILGLRLAIRKFAEGNPEEAREIRQKAGAKAISLLERLLK